MSVSADGVVDGMNNDSVFSEELSYETELESTLDVIGQKASELMLADVDESEELSAKGLEVVLPEYASEESWLVPTQLECCQSEVVRLSMAGLDTDVAELEPSTDVGGSSSESLLSELNREEVVIGITPLPGAHFIVVVVGGAAMESNIALSDPMVLALESSALVGLLVPDTAST